MSCVYGESWGGRTVALFLGPCGSSHVVTQSCSCKAHGLAPLKLVELELELELAQPFLPP